MKPHRASLTGSAGVKPLVSNCKDLGTDVPRCKEKGAFVDFDPISLWNGRRRGEILGQRIKSVMAGVLCPWLKK